MRTRFIFLIAIWIIGWLNITIAQEPILRQYAVGDWTSGAFITACIHPNGGYLVLGSANSWQQGTRTALFRLDNEGDTLWTKAYWRHDLGDRWPIDMTTAQDGSGFYILMGNAIPTIQYNAVLKVNLEGDSLWQTQVSNSTDQWVNAPFNAIGSLEDGGCVVAGNGYFFDNPPLVTALSSGGQIQWNNAISPSGAYSHYKRIRQGPDSHLFAVGTHSSYDPGMNHSRMMISKFSGSGTLLWSRQFNSGTPLSGDMRLSEGHDVLPLADGGCIITGYLTDPGITFQGQTIVRRLDQDGNEVWTKTWFAHPNDLSTGFNLQPSGSGNFLVFLHQYGSSAAGATLMKCSMDGDSIWTQWGYDYPIRMKEVQNNGQILMTGYAPSSPYGIFIRTSPDGTGSAPYNSDNKLRGLLITSMWPIFAPARVDRRRSLDRSRCSIV
ncbi:MAG: hypothetical protein H6568_16455 [Lewinellaceae bacterium]|nr:hypothetical protein [Saprospiraceae bacterium]MCB9314347.1 hypothetical protein [Lewinellaceae bacterium]